MERQCCPLRAAALTCWLLLLAAADSEIGTCTNSDSPACQEAQRRAQSVVFANYAPDKSEDEQEDVNDADVINHMQMRLNVELPLTHQETHPASGASTAHHAATGVTTKVAQEHDVRDGTKLSLLELDEIATRSEGTSTEDDAQSASAAGQQPEISSEDAAPQTDEVASPSADMQQYPSGAVRSVNYFASQVDPAFLTGYHLLIGAGFGALLVILGAVLATFLRSWLGENKSVTPEELKTQQAWMWKKQLDKALGFDADAEAERLQAELKLRAKKKAPPIHNASASDSGDTDEEEPEAESDSGGVADILEDAVFVAQQVEVANEAMDRDSRYGTNRDTRLADVIRPDPYIR